MFLATLLVLGTIATILPTAQAQPNYEDTYDPDYPSYSQDYEPAYTSDNSYYKSKDSNVILKKINCNNINSNNNGVDVNLGLPNGNDAMAEAQAEDEGQATTANEWGYGNEYKQKDSGFKFVCVNNNDNENNVIVVNETIPEPEPEPEPTITCEECFAENLTPEQLAAVIAFFGNAQIIIPPFGSIPLNLETFCKISVLASEDQVSNGITAILQATRPLLPPEDQIPGPIIEEIIQCVLEALANEV